MAVPIQFNSHTTMRHNVKEEEGTKVVTAENKKIKGRDGLVGSGRFGLIWFPSFLPLKAIQSESLSLHHRLIYSGTEILEDIRRERERERGE